MGSHSLLQEIFPTQGLNPGLQHCRQILYHLSPREAQVIRNILYLPTIYNSLRLLADKNLVTSNFLLCCCVCVCVCVCVCAHLYLTLCYPMDWSLQAPLSLEFFYVRLLECVSVSTAGSLPDPGIEPESCAS